MKKFVLSAIATVLIGFSGALASPAQDLFNQAVYYIAFYYNGYSSADFENFSAKYQPEIDSACKDTLEKCPYNAAVPVIQKMIDELSDGHTYFLSKQDRDEASQSRNGDAPATPRIGVITTTIKDSTDRLVTDVHEDSPASRAGVQRGDRLVSLNSQPSASFPDGLQPAIARANALGQPYKLGIQRGPRAFEVMLRPEPLKVRLPSMRALPGGIGLLRIPSFDVYGGIAPTVHNLVRKAQQQNLRAIIVDARDNPGGIDVEFIASAGAFVRDVSYVVQTRQSTTARVWKDNAVFVADSTGVPIGQIYPVPGAALWKGKVIVLVNANSYSGAEYFAQAIQDGKRGLVVGEVTGGLGNTVTTQYDLRDGSAMALTLGKSLHRDGTPLPERVTPDVIVKDDLDVLAATGRDLVLERAIELIGTK